MVDGNSNGLWIIHPLFNSFYFKSNHYLPNPQIIDQLQNQQPRNVHNFTYYYYYPQKTLFTKTENVMIYFNKLTD